MAAIRMSIGSKYRRLLLMTIFSAWVYLIYMSINLFKSYGGLQDSMHSLVGCTKDRHGRCAGRVDILAKHIRDTVPVISTLSTHEASQHPVNIIGQFMSTRHQGQNGGSYIVYDCSMNRHGLCGGFSDRLSGILTTFVIALLTNNTFLINHNRPCPLEVFLVPAQFEWRYNSSLLSGRTSVYRDMMGGTSTQLRNYISGKQNMDTYFGKKNLQSSFSQDIYFLRMNLDYTREFRKRPNILSEVPWIAQLSYADIYRNLFHFLFKPSAVLSRELQSLNRTRAKSACAHVRVGDNLNRASGRAKIKIQLEVLWRFMDKIDKDKYDIFIATDNVGVDTEAMKRYPKNLIQIKGPIQHIDQSNANPGEGFLKQLLDFYTLTRCDILLVGSSGFGITSAYLRNTESDLYCFDLDDEVSKPCTRSTLEDVFPGNILAPK